MQVFASGECEVRDRWGGRRCDLVLSHGWMFRAGIFSKIFRPPVVYASSSRAWLEMVIMVAVLMRTTEGVTDLKVP